MTVGSNTSGHLFDTSFTTDGVLYSGANGVITSTSAGTSTQVLTSNGPGVAPTFQPASGGGGNKMTITNVTATPYTVLTTDQFISVSQDAANTTLNFPNTATTGQWWVVKSYPNSGGFNTQINITTPGGTVTFDGQTTYVMNATFSSYTAINVIFDGSNYQVF